MKNILTRVEKERQETQQESGNRLNHDSPERNAIHLVMHRGARNIELLLYSPSLIRSFYLLYSADFTQQEEAFEIHFKHLIKFRHSR